MGEMSYICCFGSCRMDGRDGWWVVYLPNFIYVCRGEDMTRQACLLACLEYVYTYIFNTK